jgi:hypothetical protein
VKWVRVLGVAALVGVVATGVLVARQRRAWHDYDSDEIHRRLRERYEALEPATTTG